MILPIVTLVVAIAIPFTVVPAIVVAALVIVGERRRHRYACQNHRRYERKHGFADAWAVLLCLLC